MRDNINDIVRVPLLEGQDERETPVFHVDQVVACQEMTSLVAASSLGSYRPAPRARSLLCMELPFWPSPRSAAVYER